MDSARIVVFMSTIKVTKTDLLAYCSHAGNLSLQTITLLHECGIYKRQSTRRNKRSGRKILRKIPVLISRNCVNEDYWENKNPSAYPVKRSDCNIIIKTVPPPRLSVMKCALLNARSIKNKLHDIHELITENSIDVLAITGTWISDNDSDKIILSECTPPVTA